MATLRQILKEFWLPLGLAVAWTLYALYEDANVRNITGGVKTFSAAFFLLSWATGQFVRVSRQARTESALTNVEKRISILIDKFEIESLRFVSTITGGDFFAYFQMSNMSNDKNIYTPFAIHEGDYPLSNVQVRLCDLNTFQAHMAQGNIWASDTNIDLGEIAPKVGMMTGVNIKVAEPNQDWNAFFSARNGLWTQQIRGRVVGGDWKFASIVTKHLGADSVTVFVDIPWEFPQIDDALFDNAERKPAPA